MKKGQKLEIASENNDAPSHEMVKYCAVLLQIQTNYAYLKCTSLSQNYQN